MSDGREMTFERFGRSYHLRIRSAEDLSAAMGLDESLWLATGAPTDTFNCDATFLEMLDFDGDGRIMSFELRRAVEWLFRTLREPADLAKGDTSIRLDAIDTSTPDGSAIHGAIVKMLERLDASQAGEITLEQLRRIKAQVESMPIPVAGVVLPAAARDPQVRQFIIDVLATVGGADHPGGEKGVTREKLDAFLSEARAHLDWLKRPETQAEIRPLGENTKEAFEAYSALKEKIDLYFAQCDAVAFDERTAGKIKPTDADIDALDLSDAGAISAFMSACPVARPRAGGALPLADAENPAFAGEIERLKSLVVEPILAAEVDALSRQQWLHIKRTLAAYERWLADRAGRLVEQLGPETLARYLDGKYSSAVEKLIARSDQAALVPGNIRLAEKLILYRAYLLRFANNFVSFPHLYDPADRAMFEMGSLVMDGRRFDFSIRVTDRKAHWAVAKQGNMFVMYVEVLPPKSSGLEPFALAIPVTSGGMGNLRVGKRGLFEGTSGRQYDARVVGIIENPISIREAIVSPFKRLGRLLSGKIESITTKAEKKLDATAAGAMTKIEPSAAPAKRNSGLLAGGLLMGGGVAIAALGSAVAYIAKTLADVRNYWMILVVVGIAVLAVIVPTSIIAILKLRRRDLAAILEGAGWAINAPMRLTWRQGKRFTRRPGYPKKVS